MLERFSARDSHGAEALARWQTLAAAGILLALACAVYVPYFGNVLLFDDATLFNGSTIYDYVIKVWHLHARWISYASLAHIHMLSEGSIVANRVANLLVHAACSIAVFILLRQLLTLFHRPDTAIKPWTNPVIALFAAALFAVHPVAVYGVGYLIQRSILLSTLFILLMLIAWTRWLMGGRQALWAWAVFFYACSVMSKEHSVAAPAVALLLAVALHGPSIALLRRLALPMVAMAGVAFGVTLLVKGVIGAAYEPHAADMIAEFSRDHGQPRNAYLLSVVTQMTLFFKYLLLWVFPDVSRMSMDIREPFAVSIGQWPYGFAALGFVAYGAFATVLTVRGGRHAMVGWLFAYPWIMFLTELTTVRIQEPFVLYRAYLWFPLFAMLPILALARLGIRPVIVIVSVLVCTLVPLSWHRLHALSEPLTAWNDAARLIHDESEMGALRIYYNRALALSGKGRKTEALLDLQKVIAHKPNLAPIRMARARVYFDLKQYPQALADLNASIDADASRASAYYARAVTLRRMGRDAEARADFGKSCDLGDAIACFALARGSPPTGDVGR